MFSLVLFFNFIIFLINFFFFSMSRFYGVIFYFFSPCPFILYPSHVLLNERQMVSLSGGGGGGGGGGQRDNEGPHRSLRTNVSHKATYFFHGSLNLRPTEARSQGDGRGS